MFASPGLHFCHVLAHAERASDERARTATSTESFMVDEMSLVSRRFVVLVAKGVLDCCLVCRVFESSLDKGKRRFILSATNYVS